MKRLFLIAFLVCSPVASAEQQIYVVDVQKVVSESVIGKAAKSNLESEMKKSESKLVAQKQEVEKLVQDFNKQKALLSKEALEQKAEALRRKERDAKLLMAEEQDKIRRKNSQEIDKVVAEVKAILDNLAEDQEYSMIVEKDPRLVVYVDPKYDITQKVIKALDSKTLN